MNKEPPAPQPHLWDGTPMAAMPYVISNGNDTPVHRVYEGMKMSKHTNGKLELEEVANDSGHIKHLCPIDRNGMSLLTVVEHADVKFAAVYTDDDARRLVACWNALEDLPQDALDGGWTRAGLEAYGLQMKAERDRLSAINAELLEALEEAQAAMNDHVSAYPHMDKGYMVDARSSARAAIAKAQGEQL
jgi:hypothetical protein